MKLRERFIFMLGLGLFALCTAAPAAAQAYPKGVVNVVVGAPPGGPTDFAGRIVAEQLQAAWDQPVVVVNKPGAGGVIAVNMVAKSPPDGQTILLDTTSHVINPALRAATIPYKTPDDFEYVTQLTSLQIVLVANPAAPFNTVSELIAYAKAHPGKISYASPGIGLASHLAAELLKIEANIDMVHVPYNGSGPAQLDVISGRVDIMFDVYHSAKQFAEQGKLKILALASASQPENIKVYPLISETIPGFSVTSFFGLIVPRGTPRPIIDRIQQDIVRAINKPDVKARLEKVGMKVVGSKPEEFAEFVGSESAKWAKVIKVGNLKAE
ncbi:MAG: tripartite tricarboxylate transporter substrate binding protein [Burkholderiaceae bacterium]|nr:tripartite tricarboxylate transporter substrate binding protein [Burkholderiaceae bacterium]